MINKLKVVFSSHARYKSLFSIVVKVGPEPERPVRSGEVRERTQQVPAFCQTVGDVVTLVAVHRHKPCSGLKLY